MAVNGIPKNRLGSGQITNSILRHSPEEGAARIAKMIEKYPMANQNVDTSTWVNQPGTTTPNPNGVGAKQPVADYANNPQYKQLNQQRSQTLAEIHRRGGLAKTPGFATKLNDLNSQIRGMRRGVPGTGGPLLTDNGSGGTTPPPAVPPSPAAPDTSAADASKALYPSMNYTLPENYQGSPMYKFQMDQGTQALNRKLAQRGLLDSGAELEATNKLSSEVGAQESDRLRQDYQTEADRYERVSANEANRLQRDEDSNWNRRMDVINQLTKQSPMNEAYAGTNKYSDLSMGRGKNKSSNTANNYKRVSAGGGRAGPGAFVPPGQSGPDYSQADLMAMLMGNSGSRQNGNIIDSFIGSLSSLGL